MSDTVHATVSGLSGRLTLDRPKALNSLDTTMVRAIAGALERWRADDAVAQVILDSAHPKAFCAGGDVRAVREAQLAGDFASGDEFFAVEYRMNAAIAEFPKPYLALIDGIAMGGGLGVSLHGSHRVVTERASAAMPEMAIGFVPDVGVSHLSQRTPVAGGAADPAVARFLGLTGYRLDAAELLWAGWATHYIGSADIPAFLRRADAAGVDAALAEFARDPAEAGEPALARWRAEIDAVFGAGDYAAIEAALDAPDRDPGFRAEVGRLLRPAAPTSLVAATELYRANLDVDLRTALGHELVIGGLLRRHHNFAEGVRAVLVDKDRAPRFDPERAASVDPAPYREALAAAG